MPKHRTISVRLDDLDYEIASEAAAAWGIPLATFARLQLTMPTDWGLRRQDLYVASSHERAAHEAQLRDEGNVQLPSGWWKHRD